MVKRIVLIYRAQLVSQHAFYHTVDCHEVHISWFVIGILDISRQYCKIRKEMHIDFLMVNEPSKHCSGKVTFTHYWPCHLEQFGVKYLAWGHIEMLTAGGWESNQQPSDWWKTIYLATATGWNIACPNDPKCVRDTADICTQTYITYRNAPKTKIGPLYN